MKDSRLPALSLTPDLERVEFHRHAYALLPEADDPRPGVAFLVDACKNEVGQRFCSCQVGKGKTCAHLAFLEKAAAFLRGKEEGSSVDGNFRASVWRRLASILADCERTPLVSVSCRGQLRVYDAKDREIFVYLSSGADRRRFQERLSLGSDAVDMSTRAAVLARLMQSTYTKNERAMQAHGVQTRGQAEEESFWFRAAYHCFREWGDGGCVFSPAVEQQSGNFIVCCSNQAGLPVCRFVVPRPAVQQLLVTLNGHLPNQHGFEIHPIPLRSIFKVDLTTEMDLDIRPQIELLQVNGEKRYYESGELDRFRYGRLVYLPEVGILAEMEREDSKRQFRAPQKMFIKRTQVPSFLDDMAAGTAAGSFVLPDELKEIRFLRTPDRLTFAVAALERDWCWLEVSYGFGNSTVSLQELLAARQEGSHYIAMQDGWIDCQSESLAVLDGLRLLDGKEFGDADGRLRLSRLDLFRLQATVAGEADLKGDAGQQEMLARILQMRPAAVFDVARTMTSSLRPYQKLGVDWLLFLHENGLGGLLCDDMGLGKTHQVMAFLSLLKENDRLQEPCLLVCPTTVMSHWQRKLAQHAPGLAVTTHYGTDRALDRMPATGGILLTTYGVLLRDVDMLNKHSFAIAVFDEMQYLKNSATRSSQASRQIVARMKLGLTGTPIENDLGDLKALMDIVAPGYLGADQAFRDRFLAPLANDPTCSRREELRRLVSPFTLRRMKRTVLDELPPKIEDTRFCVLSDDQVSLYRDAIAARGASLAAILEAEAQPLPYIHIFALLSLLKQICNHPALVKGEPEDYEQYASGKWDLFEEILTESLDSGQKVVVYSQFLGMIRIMEKFLAKSGIGHVVLTGASRNRGELISRFNTDPDCRVFVGSLMASGAGIDLVAASVVIHYDRWWNAAREDQATDRVHRIGQNRGVQVFKLVTQGTMEEKIAAIIDKKKELLEQMIQEDDPDILRAFSREQILLMLAPPAPG